MGYDDITRMEKELNIQVDLSEVSNVAISNTADVPDGSFVPKGKKRKLNTDKSEDWYKNLVIELMQKLDFTITIEKSDLESDILI